MIGKREIVQYLLDNYQEVMVTATLKGRNDCDVPDVLRSHEALMLRMGYRLAPPIPDLELTDRGIEATLSFNGKPYKTFLAWEAVSGAGVNGFCAQWLVDAPSSVVETEKPKAGHLKLVN